MGNSLGGKRRRAKVMKIDGTILRIKPPVTAGDLLLSHPSYSLLESEEVKQLGLRAVPLDPARLLKPGNLYFLVELPRLPDQRVPRRAWSGNLQLGARDRLESLLLSRRAVSDLSHAAARASMAEVDVESLGREGPVRLKLRLPKAQVAKLVEESKDAAEAADKIVNLLVARDVAGGLRPPSPPQQAPLPTVRPQRKEKRTRFMALPDEIIA